MSVPKTQRAWIIERQGHPSDSLVLKNDHPVPLHLEPGEVLVKIQAAALNPVGYKLMNVLPNFIARRPLVAEHDFAGSVVNGNGTEFKEGDQVFGFIDVSVALRTRQGSLAEYAAVPVNCLFRRPENITPIEAAGISVVAQSALECLAAAKLEPDMSIFINGGSTSVGLFAIQVAKARGIKVTASASGRNEELVRRMGADEFVDYTKRPLHEHFTANPPNPKFHAIIDAVGLLDPSLYTHSAIYLAPNGAYVTTGPYPSHVSREVIVDLLRTLFAVTRPVLLGGVNRKYILIRVKHHQEILDELRELLAENKLKVTIDSVYSFEDVLGAYERIMTSRATGKIIVRMETV